MLSNEHGTGTRSPDTLRARTFVLPEVRGPMQRLRLAGAQLNTVVGDIDGNVEKIVGSYREAAGRGAHLVVYPELAVTGYPPEDLVFKPAFLEASRAGMETVAAATAGHPGTAAVIGFVDPT